jgi:branched-chain amino acid transport system permease protein
MALLSIGTLINISMMIILCIGFTFTYMMEGFLNFSQVSYASMGALVSFYLTRIIGLNPYFTWPFSALVGGMIGLMLYIGVVRPIKRNGGSQEITLTLVFLVIAQVIPSFAYIFNYWAHYALGTPTQGYNLRAYDFNWNGFSGISIMSVVSCVTLVVMLHYFLRKTRTGISLRATSENEGLAATIGVNTFRAHCTSWFIAGALSALAGSIITINRGMGVSGPDDSLIINVMSGAVFGGLYSIYGAILGGIFVAVAQDILKNLLYAVFGLPVLKWQSLMPLGLLLTVLTIFPNGISGGYGQIFQGIRRLVSKTVKFFENKSL